MTQRKSPYEHKVNGHYRGGKFIENYERGKGKKPRQKPVLKHVKNTESGLSYMVTLRGEGKSETYKGYGSPVSSLKQAVGKLQQAIVPTEATLRRIK